MKNWKERFEGKFVRIGRNSVVLSDGSRHATQFDIDELVSFIEQVEKEAIEGERERIYLAFQSFAAKYSLHRPIPPAELRLFL